MRHTTRLRTRTTAAALALAFGLAACGGTELQAETATSEGESDEDQVAELEAELADLRGDTNDEDGAGSKDGDDGGAQGGGSGDDPTGADGDGPLVIELDETRATNNGDVEITMDRALVHDYWVEVELSMTNLHTEDRMSLWGSGNSRPRLFDEQDRRFEYQHPAGMDNMVSLQPGQTVDASLVFGGRVHPNAEVLTVRFETGDVGIEEFTFSLAEGSR